jgi:hypothetical protein
MSVALLVGMTAFLAAMIYLQVAMRLGDVSGNLGVVLSLGALMGGMTLSLLHEYLCWKMSRPDLTVRLELLTPDGVEARVVPLPPTPRDHPSSSN